MNFIRLVAIGGLALTVIYLSVAWFARSLVRERLEKEWDAANPGGDPEARRAAVERGVEAFRGSLLYKALWLIYILPVALIVLAFYLTN